MQVNVFVTRIDGQLQHELLVLPLSPQSSIPTQYRDGWTYFVTVETGDQIFGNIDALSIERAIATSGFAVVKPRVPDRR